MPPKQVGGRSSLIANQTTSFFLVSGFGSGAYSAKLLNGTRQRFSGFSQPRQCGDVVFRMLVTGVPECSSRMSFAIRNRVGPSLAGGHREETAPFAPMLMKAARSPTNSFAMWQFRRSGAVQADL